MKKKIKIYGLMILLSMGGFGSCDILDKKPLDMISEDIVWDDPTLVDAYMVSQYADMTVLKMDEPQNLGGGWAWKGSFQYVIDVTDEVTQPTWDLAGTTNWRTGSLNISGGFMEYWETPYTIIRRLNELIEKLPTSANEQDFIDTRVAEARFMRAFNYFYMVKRYGGVPLVTKALPLDAPAEEMYPKRNTEQEVYDFILSEIDAVEETLAGLPDEYGRVNQGVALALKCRAALYAGSIAQFGTVQKGGLVGIPSELSKGYYQQAYDAAVKLQGLGKYSLYSEDADKVQNFKNIFLKEHNCEMIFANQYDVAQNSWWWGFLLAPKPHGYNMGMCSNPSLEMVEEFEYIDGRPGVLDREAIQNKLWTMDELWKDKDPRFFASVWTNGTSWKGEYVTSYKGLIDGSGKLLENEQDAYQGIPAWGNQHITGNFGSGFGILKMLDETSNANMDEKDGIDCPVFRYGEVLLNLAEAAFELGKTGEALDAINQIRERAGIAPRTTIDRESIRHERKVELAFEGHRYWDARRWRIAEDVFSKQPSGLRYILDYNSSDFSNSDYNTARKFKIQVIPNYDARKPQFNEEHYYLPITKARTEQNTNLDENPGYK